MCSVVFLKVACVCNGFSCIVIVLLCFFKFIIIHYCLLITIYPSILFMAFQLSHDLIVVLTTFALFLVSKISSLSSSLYRDCCTRAKALLETASLPP